MATYKKKLKSIVVYMFPSGMPQPPVTDTATDDKATRMLNEFKNYETMNAHEGEGDESGYAEVPYHAVQYIKVTETEVDIEKADAYGCE